MMPSLLQAVVAYSRTDKIKLRLRGAVLERNITTTEIWEERHMMPFSQDNGWLSTSIQPVPMALLRKCPRQGHTLWLALMERHTGLEQRSDWLLLRPLMRRSSRVQESSQSTERSINSYDAQRTPAPPKEVSTCSGRLMRPPTRLNSQQQIETFQTSLCEIETFIYLYFYS